MKKNLRSCIEQPEYSEAVCFLDMNGYDWIEASGMKPDLGHKKSAHLTAAWRFAQTARVRIPLEMSDLSGYRYLTFSAFAVQGAGGSFALRFESDETAGGESGYSCLLPITRNGWNDYRVELPTLAARKSPAGWNHITGIVMDCAVGGQANSTATTLCFDNFYLWENLAPQIYVKMPELKGAAMFSRTAAYAVVDRKRLPIAPDADPAARPFEADGVLWLPMAPIAAAIAHRAVVDNKANTLSFTYRRKKYAFSGDSEAYTVDGEKNRLGFLPKIAGGTLFFPAQYVMDFFRWRQIFTSPLGLVILSNRRNVFDAARDAGLLWQLNAEITFVQPTAERVVEDLRRKIPNADRCRLLLTHDEWFALRRAAKKPGEERRLMDLIKKKYGKQTEAYRGAPSGDTAWATCENIIAWSALYRVTGERSYALRVLGEMNALARLDGWGAEKSVHDALAVGYACAIGYDWCRQTWTEAQKAPLERAMLRFALRPGVDCLRGTGRMWHAGTSESAENLCALVALALALAEAYPETSYRVFRFGGSSLISCFAAYAPDGGYPEGIAAWEKATRALALTIAMLRSACGTDYGFASAPGFSQTALFGQNLETKNGMWNLCGAKAGMLDTSVFGWFSLTYGNEAFAWLRRQDLLSGKKTVSPYDLVFYRPLGMTESPVLPLDSVRRRAGIVTLRSAWGEDACFVGLHGGSNHEVGGVLDAGSFCLEMGGVRFLSACGNAIADPALRRRAEWQNTVTVDPQDAPYPDQNPQAVAAITEAKSAPDRAFAAVDLGGISDKLLRAKRGALLYAHRSVAVIQDEMQLADAGVVVWSACTEATVVRNGGRYLLLERDGKTLLCRIYGGGTSKFEVLPIGETPFSRLVIRVEAKDRVRLAVAFALTDAPDAKLYELQPMSKWEMLQ